MRRNLLLLAISIVLAACSGSPGDPDDGGGTPGDGSPASGGFHVTGITVRGGLADAEAITVRGVPDQDETVDTAYHVAFVLGGSGPVALPADDGTTAWSAVFPVTRVGGAQPALDELTVSIEP